MIATVLSMIPVLFYSPVLHLSFRPPVGLITIIGHVHVIGHNVETGILVVVTDHYMERGIPRVLQTDEEDIDTSKTEMAQEQSVHKRALILVFQMKNQHLNQVHHQTYNILLPRFCPSSATSSLLHQVN